jgi:hypothetical protein
MASVKIKITNGEGFGTMLSRGLGVFFFMAKKNASMYKWAMALSKFAMA